MIKNEIEPEPAPKKTVFLSAVLCGELLDRWEALKHCGLSDADLFRLVLTEAEKSEKIRDLVAVGCRQESD